MIVPWDELRLTTNALPEAIQAAARQPDTLFAFLAQRLIADRVWAGGSAEDVVFAALRIIADGAR